MAPKKSTKLGVVHAKTTDVDSSKDNQHGLGQEITATTESIDRPNTADDQESDDDREGATVEDLDAPEDSNKGESESEEENLIHGPRRGRGVIPSIEVLNSNSRRASRFQDALVHTLRQRLDRAVMSNEVFRHYLRSNNWNLELAEASLNDDFAVAQVRDGFALEGRSLDQVDADYVQGAGSTQESHRRSIDVLYRRLNVGRTGNARHVIIALELGLLLNRNNWVVESAMAEFSSQQLNLAAQLAAVTEMRALRTATSTQLNQDKRLATFLELTGTAFIASATEILRRHGYDLGLAVDAWMRSSMIALETHTGHSSSADAPARLSSELGNRWPNDRPISVALTNIKPEELMDANKDYVTGSAEARSGFLIRYDQQPARRSMPNPKKLQIESIRGGKYRLLKHAGITVPGTGKIGKTGREVGRNHRQMDWENPADITELNKWFSQPRRRVDKKLRRKQPAGYLPLEHDWIHQYFRQKYDDVLLENPDYQKKGGRWPIPIDTKQLAQDFNTQFAGRKDIPGQPSDEPRPIRNASGISVYTKRQPTWCKEFGLKYTPAHKERTAGGSKRRTTAVSPPSIACAETPQDDVLSDEEYAEHTSVNNEKPNQESEATPQDRDQTEQLHEDDLDDDEIEELRQVQPFEAERILRRRAERDRQRAAQRAAQRVEAFGREGNSEEATVPIGSTGQTRKRSASDESNEDRQMKGLKRQRG